MVTLERALTFTEKEELEEYLKGNLLNKELYKAYLANKDNYYRWKNSPLTTFNEVYYQCTRIFNDPHPESEIYYTYLNDAKYTLGTRYASDMLFSMVNAVFEIMEDRPSNVEFFQMELQAYLKNEQCYYQQYLEFAKKFVETNGKQKVELKYTPLPPNRLIYEPNDWQELTNDFDELLIRKLVKRYEKTVDKLAFIDKIEEAYNKVETEKARIENEPDLPF